MTSEKSGRDLHCYDYVNRPYRKVRDALAGDARSIFRNATRKAADRAESLAATLRTQLGPIDVGAEVDIDVDPAVEETPGGESKTRIDLRWTASRAAAFFPRMHATLFVYPLTATETQLELRGIYQPPFGVLGTAIDGLAMHRVAEASVLRFVSDVARYLGSIVSAE